MICTVGVHVHCLTTGCPVFPPLRAGTMEQTCDGGWRGYCPSLSSTECIHARGFTKFPLLASAYTLDHITSAEGEILGTGRGGEVELNNLLRNLVGPSAGWSGVPRQEERRRPTAGPSTPEILGPLVALSPHHAWSRSSCTRDLQIMAAPSNGIRSGPPTRGDRVDRLGQRSWGAADLDPVLQRLYVD